MAALSEFEKREIDLLAKGATSLVEMDRNGAQITRDNRDREDKYTIWIVGLSAAAIAGLLSVSPKLASIPQWQAVPIFLLFGVSIISGIIYSWILKEHQTVSDEFHYTRQGQFLVVLSVMLPRAESIKDIKEAQTRLQEIYEKQDEIIVEQLKTAKRWEKRAEIFSYGPPAAFIFGVIALAGIGSYNWSNKLPVDITPKQVPQIRQG